ncbi:MAG: Ig-like domain-containing protein, partial [Dissulfurispiraceae bacterium]
IAVTPANPGIALKTTEQFTATGTFSDHSTQNITTSVTWSSSAKSVATISNAAGSFGLVTPVAAGTATITATSGSISGSTALTVSSATLVSIAVTSISPGIALGTTEQFTATGTFSDNSTQNITTYVTWSSSATSVAAISNAAGSNGQLTSVATGNTTITATSGSISGSATLAVTSEPFVTAFVLSLASGSNPLGWLQQIQVYTDSLSFIPITIATVTVNGSPLSYNATNQSYDGNVAIAAGAAVNLSVTVGEATYTSSGTQFTTFPSVTAPTSGSTWQSGNVNTITWTAGAPTAGATYFIGLINSTGNFVFPGKNPVNVPTSSTSYTIPGNSLTAGNYELLVGIGTQGIGGETTGGIPIPKTAAGSGLWIGGIKAFVPITVK